MEFSLQRPLFRIPQRICRTADQIFSGDQIGRGKIQEINQRRDKSDHSRIDENLADLLFKASESHNLRTNQRCRYTEQKRNCERQHKETEYLLEQRPFPLSNARSDPVKNFIPLPIFRQTGKRL